MEKGRDFDLLPRGAHFIDYMRAIVLEPFRAVYVVIPKVAATSFKTLFAPHLGIELNGRSPHLAAFPQPRGRSPFVRRVRYLRYFKFGFVRNPWARLLSCYKDKIQNQSAGGDTHFTIRPGVADCLARFDQFTPGMDFDAFVKAVAEIPDEEANRHFRSQHTFFHSRWGMPVNFVGKQESLLEDWEAVRRRIGFPDTEPPHRKFTPSTDYRAAYSDMARDLVAERYAVDIETFGYRF